MQLILVRAKLNIQYNFSSLFRCHMILQKTFYYNEIYTMTKQQNDSKTELYIT